MSFSLVQVAFVASKATVSVSYSPVQTLEKQSNDEFFGILSDEEATSLSSLSKSQFGHSFRNSKGSWSMSWTSSSFSGKLNSFGRSPNFTR